MSVAYKDYYEILGVSKTATEQEIKSAYRKLAKKYHPDVNKTAGAEQKYKDVNEAYEVLHDPEKRQKYDTLGPNWEQAQQFGGQGGGFEGFGGFPGGGVHMDFGGSGSGFSDFFETLFGNMGRSGSSRGFNASDIFGRAANRVLAAHAGIGWSSGSHTALPTLTTAQGPGAEILVGMKENADLGKRLKKLLKP